MKTIIVLTDFSPVSVNALNYAVEMAQSINASILLLHVYQLPIPYSTNDLAIPVIDIHELEEINKDRMEETKKQLEHISNGKLRIQAQVKMGDLVDELKTLCEIEEPFVVVMGSKGAGFVERLVTGSAALSVIKHLTWPVILVPPGCIFKGIKKIGFACDFKKVVETTPADYIKELVTTFGAELNVLNVDDNKDHITPAIPTETSLLYTLLEEASPEYFFINNTDVEKGVHEFAETNNIDLLIIIPKKHRLLDSLFQKSHTTELAFHSHIPLLAIHEE